VHLYPLQNIREYESFDGVPRDLIQQVLNELVRKQLLSPENLELFCDCSLQVRFIRDTDQLVLLIQFSGQVLEEPRGFLANLAALNPTNCYLRKFLM